MSSSDTLPVIVESLQQSNYLSLVVFTAIVYDYVLTFSKEIEYIWSRPWTFVTSLFILVRYCGLSSTVFDFFFGDTFMPQSGGLQQMYVFVPCNVINLFANWTGAVFLIAADLAMILRVWAMYHRSKLVLGTLLTLFIVESILGIVMCIMMSSSLNQVTVVVAQVLDFTFCNLYIDATLIITWSQVTAIFQLALGTLTCVLIFVQYMRESLQMYKATKTWQSNQYTKLFFREGLAYYLVVLLHDIIVVLNFSEAVSGYDVAIPYSISGIAVTTLSSRFIMSIRELHSRDVRGGHIDSGFGLSTLSGRAGNVSEIAFAEGGQNPQFEQEDLAIRD